MTKPLPAAQALVDAILQRVETTDNRVRAEDAVHAAAAACGEACLLKAGHIDVETTDMAPWQPILSDLVNGYIGESKTNSFRALDPDTVFGILYRRLVAAGFADEDFPDLFQLFARNAQSVASPAQPWGYVALSVPPENRPRDMSIRVAYEMREPVASLCRHFRIAEGDRPALCASALAEILVKARDAINHRTALLLACEIVVGVAKRVPMSRRIIEQKSREQAPQPQRE